MKPRFRFILLAVYLLVSGALFAGCFLNMGHSEWCQYFINSMLPAELMHGVLRHVLVPWGIVQESSDAFRLLDVVLGINIPFILTLAQYYFVGLLIDRVISRRAGRNDFSKN